MVDRSVQTCDRCGTDLVRIELLVDGSNLVMHSCTTCDVRSWSLGGEAVDLAQALTEVGDRSGRRR